MQRWTPYLWMGATVLAGTVNALLPLPYDMPGADARAVKAFAVLLAAALAGLPSVLIRGALAAQRTLALAAIAGFAPGVAAYFGQAAAMSACTAVFDGHIAKAIGTEYTELGKRYKQAHPNATNSQLLDDSTGDPELAWTRQSIGRCRTWIAATYYTWAPLLIFAIVTTVRAAAAGPALPARKARKKISGEVEPAPIRYDAFVSYRHDEADTRFVSELVRFLEADGYRVALDARDFDANAHFLTEMERCTRASRFTLAVISSAYLNSGNCAEEAVICKVMDMADRKSRLVPLLIEAVALPPGSTASSGSISRRPTRWSILWTN